MKGKTYDAALARIFGKKLRNIKGFRLIVKKHIQKEEKEELEENSNRKAKDLTETLKSIQGDKTNKGL